MPPTATTLPFSNIGWAMRRRESYCKTESASMQIKYGKFAALMPMFSASALPPFFFRMSVTGTFCARVS